jgi:hypothetical protein
LRTAWVTQQVQGQPQLQIKILSQKRERKIYEIVKHEKDKESINFLWKERSSEEGTRSHQVLPKNITQENASALGVSMLMIK